MSESFRTYEHYPIIDPSGRSLGQTQPGDLVQLWGSVAYGKDHKTYGGEWESVWLRQVDWTIIDGCYLPAAAIDLRDYTA